MKRFNQHIPIRSILRSIEIVKIFTMNLFVELNHFVNLKIYEYIFFFGLFLLGIGGGLSFHCLSDIIEVDEEYEGAISIGEQYNIKINNENHRIYITDRKTNTRKGFSFTETEENIYVYKYDDDHYYTMIKHPGSFIALGYNVAGRDEIIIASKPYVDQDDTPSITERTEAVVYNAFLPKDSLFGVIQVFPNLSYIMSVDPFHQENYGFFGGFEFTLGAETTYDTYNSPIEFGGYLISVSEELVIANNVLGEGMLLMMESYPIEDYDSIIGNYNIITLSQYNDDADPVFERRRFTLDENLVFSGYLSDIFNIEKTLPVHSTGYYKFEYGVVEVIVNFIPGKMVYIMTLSDDPVYSFFAIGIPEN